MKTITTALITLSTLFLLNACGGGGGTTDGGDKTAMVLGKSYTMHSGDKIHRDTDDAVVTLTANLEDNTTVAALTKGKASIEQ